MYSLKLATVALILLSIVSYISFVGTDVSFLSIPLERPSQKNYVSEIKFTFEDTRVGELPIGFVSLVAGSGSVGTWQVLNDNTAPSGSQVLAQTSQDTAAVHFPILVLDESIYSDAKVSARVKTVSGSVDQAGGIVFRFIDTRNYYVARVNARENNVQLYKFIDARIFPLASIEVDVESNRWHLLEIEAIGSTIRCYYEGRLVIEKEDISIQSGKVGFWTKSDSVIYFDDFVIKR